MIKEEFKSTQAFMYPDEYDIYDQAAEGAMKTNFAGKKAKGDFE